MPRFLACQLDRCRQGWLPTAVLPLVLALAVLAPWSTSGASAARLKQTRSTSSVTTGPATASAVKLASNAGEQDWSSLGQIIYQQVDAAGITQIFTMNPDGSDVTQLPSPAADRHKFNPAWYPNGQWFAAQVERTNYVQLMDKDPNWTERLVNGLWCDLYVASADGSQWYKLTNTGLNTDGVLFPTFSPDGTKLMWSRIVQNPTSGMTWGKYRLMLGDFSFVGGVPTLTNVRDVTPSGINFIEPGGFSPDGSHVVVSSDVDATSSNKMNVLIIDLSTGSYVDLTKTDNLGWHEHPSYSPDGQHIVYMSGIPWQVVTADLVMINLDGSGWMQLTHFNTPGYPEYAGEGVYAYHARWSPDGKQLSVTTQSVAHYPARDMWVVTFK